MGTPHEGPTVAIVGGGAIGTALFGILVDRLSVENSLRAKTRLVLVEKSERVGPGLAYAKDESPYLLNQSAQTMSLVPGHRAHFCEWLDQRGLFRAQKDEDVYCERQLFGDYVEDQLARARDKACRAGLSVSTVRDEVSTFASRRSGGYRIATSGQPPIDADVAVLAVGNLPSTKFRDLEVHPNFIASPYPSSAMRSRIPPNARVAILGSGLSAIDAVLALFASGHESAVTMASPSGLLPAIRGPLPVQPLHYLTRANIARATDHGRRALRWSDVLQWLRMEIERHDLSLSWDRDFPSWVDPIEHYTSQLAAARGGARVWQSIGEALNPIVEVIWHHLAAADKRLFVDQFYSRFMSHWVPIPIVNGERILSLLQARQLTVDANLARVTFDDEARCFRLYSSDSRTTTFDYVVNATGTQRHLSDCDSPLVHSLLRQGIIAPHEFGGLEVDFESLRVVGRSGVFDPSLFALGNLTSGTHLFTSTLELNVDKAERVAGQIVSELLRRNAKDCPPHVDATPHST